MTDTYRFDLMTVEGPHEVYAFDIDNPTEHLVRLQLVRSTGSVLVEQMVMPWHVHREPDMAGRPRWLWEAGVDAEIRVPELQSVTLRAYVDMPASLLLTPWIATRP
jgi:hypothetical protein